MHEGVEIFSIARRDQAGRQFWSAWDWDTGDHWVLPVAGESVRAPRWNDPGWTVKGNSRQ